MITDERLTHIIKVARTAQRLAERLRPNDKEFHEDMFLLGFVHDVGYEFSDGGKFHSKISGEIVENVKMFQRSSFLPKCWDCPLGGYCGGGCSVSCYTNQDRFCHEEFENFEYLIQNIILPIIRIKLHEVS
ncbi:MAG: hypothetical protein IJ525_06985 [Alphaproteobacteria bacterium]|nr:hypothetical protein [Alphaproteobacteria bacterium]